jgi:hypothetical protein
LSTVKKNVVAAATSPMLSHQIGLTPSSGERLAPGGAGFLRGLNRIGYGQHRHRRFRA